GRWDSAFGEMMLSADSVSGYAPGDVRFIEYDHPPGVSPSYLLTDEQPNVTVAGNYVFGGHWEAGYSLRITNRAADRGAFNAPIEAVNTDFIATSQDTA